MRIERRHFLLRLGMGAAGAGLLSFAAAQSEGSHRDQAGNILYRPADGRRPGDGAPRRRARPSPSGPSIENNTAEWMIQTRKKLEANGVEVYNIGMLDLHCDPTLVLSLPGVEQKIELYKTYLNEPGPRRHPLHDLRAHVEHQEPAGAGLLPDVGRQARGATPRLASSTWRLPRTLPCSFDKEYQEEQIWKSFTTFIRAVIPVAEKNKVRIGLHPDDPPVAVARMRGAGLPDI